MKLYEIAKEYEGILDAMYSQDSISEEQIAEINKIENDFNQKAVAIASFIENLNAELSAVSNAIDSMKTRERSLENKIKHLKEYLKFHMEKMNITKITDSPYFKISIAKNPPKLDLYNEQAIPNEYFIEKQITARVLDKSKLDDDLRSGKEIAGAKQIQQTRLVIK